MPKRRLDAAFMAAEAGSVSSSRHPNSLFVSFSKRRKGLFRKATELCKICNAEVAVIVLSPTGNPFAFGHSSVDAVLHRYYLQQTTPPNSTNYPLMITGTGITGRFGAISDKHRHQTQQVEALKARVKQAQNREGSTLGELKAWIERAWESCKSVEELESLKHMYLTLLENVRNRLLRRSSSSVSGEETSTTVVGPVHSNEEYLISGTCGFDGKVGQTGTVVGPVEEYVLDDFDDKYFVGSNGFDGNNAVTQCVGMAADIVFQNPDGDDSSDADHGSPCSQNDMSCFLPGELLVVQTSNYGTVVELLDNDDLSPCLVNGGFDDHGNNSDFSPHPDGGESSANVFGDVHPLAVMGPPNDLPYNSIENFGHHECAGSSYSEMVGVSDDEVFNYLGQLPSFCDLDALESTQVFDRKSGSFWEDDWFLVGAEELISF